jgi:hypothetical protein
MVKLVHRHVNATQSARLTTFSLANEHYIAIWL